MTAAAWLRKNRVAVLKGGWSRERSISLKTGAAVESAFKRLKIPATGIDVRRDISDQLKKHRIKFAFIALHGAFGEDGGIQGLLDLMRVPYTGSGSIPSRIAMDKILSKQLFVRAHVPTPQWLTLAPHDPTSEAKKWIARGPVFVKPFDQGSAIGVSRVEKTSGLPKALAQCFRVSKKAIVEKFVAGRELTVGVLGKRALPVVEIVPEHAFYDFHSKYARGGSRHLVPAPIPARVAQRAQRLSLRAFAALGCTVYGRVDVMLDNKENLFVLEVNTIPGMTSTSLLPDAAKAAGISFDDLVLRICALSISKRSEGR